MEKEVIWKYEIEVRDDYVIEIPAHAEILYLGVQKKGITIRGTSDERAYIWVKVNPYNKGVKRHFKVCGTGHPVDEDGDTILSYIGTFQFGNGFVGHVFEII